MDDEQDQMSERELERLLAEALEHFADTVEDDPAATDRMEVDTFEAAGVMTENRGLVVRIGAAEFQVTIVRSG